MKKKLVALLLCGLMLLPAGCGSGIKQEDYDTLKATSDSLQSEKDALESEKIALQSEKTSLQNENTDLESEKVALQSEKEQLSEDLQTKSSKLTSVNDKYTSYKAKMEPYEKVAEEDSKKEEEKATEETAPETESQTDKSEVTDLFKDVYLPYAKREKPFIFEAVKTFAQNTTEYTTEIHEPSESEPCSIKFIADNGDYVYFSFSPSLNDIYVIMTVSYYQEATNSEVSLNNYSTDGSPAYDILQTHVVGESSVDVDTTDKQQEFLFH